MRHTFYNKALAATLILTAGLAVGPLKADAQWRTDIPADFSLTGTYSGDTGTRTLSAAYTANNMDPARLYAVCRGQLPEDEGAAGHQ